MPKRGLAQRCILTGLDWIGHVMKVRDIAAKHGLDASAFEEWLVKSGRPFKPAWAGPTLDGNTDVQELVSAFKQHQEELRRKQAQQAEKERQRQAQKEQQREQERKRQAQKEQAKNSALKGMLITTESNFDGYTITKYSGCVFGDAAISIARPTDSFWNGVRGNVASDLLHGLAKIRREALASLRTSAAELGCNAIIGVKFDYINMDPETANTQGGTLYLPFLFTVTASGTAVVVERN